MSWETELVTIVRYLINDLADSPTYSDARLQQAIVISASMVVEECNFTAYTIDVSGIDITTDPTDSTRDTAFINLTALKTACFIDNSTFRTKANAAGMSIKTGPHSIDSKGSLEGYKYLLENGACKAYEDAKQDYVYGSLIPGRAILGPFNGINIDTSYPWSGYGRSPRITD